LDLPADAKIHPVVHVSQLKKQVPPVVVVSSDLSTICTDPMKEMVPQRTLQDRTILRGSSVIHQKLVQWQELPSSMATWEDTTVLLKKYPKLLA
jgi:hypothetical protein